MIILTKLVIDINEPEYNTVLWYQPNDKIVYIYLNGEWVPLNSNGASILELQIAISDIQVSISNFEDCCTNVTNHINNILQELNLINKKIGDVTIDINSVKSTLSQVQSTVNNFNTKINQYDTKISNAESKVSTLTSTVDRFNSTLTTHTTNIQTINTNIATLDKSVNDIKSDINEMNECCEDVQNQLSTIEGKVTNFNTQVNSLLAQFNAFQQQYSQVNVRIDNIETLLQNQPVGDCCIKYNTDLNAASVGVKTIATGQDQFVFGGYNEKDDSKIEIVGCGDESIDVIKIRFAENEVECIYIGNLTEQDIEPLGEKLLPLVRNKYINRPIYFAPKFSGDNNIATLINQLKVTHSCQGDLYFVKWQSIPLDNTDGFCLLACNNNTALTKNSAITVKNWDAVLFTTVEEIELVPHSSNLRTLDKDGNQFLAGGLITKSVQWYGAVNGSRTITADEIQLAPIIKYVECETITLYDTNNASITYEFPLVDDLQLVTTQNNYALMFICNIVSRGYCIAWYPHVGWEQQSNYTMWKSSRIDSQNVELEASFIYNNTTKTITRYNVKQTKWSTGEVKYYTLANS